MNQLPIKSEDVSIFSVLKTRIQVIMAKTSDRSVSILLWSQLLSYTEKRLLYYRPSYRNDVQYLKVLGVSTQYSDSESFVGA